MILIPVKNLSNAKQRLASMFDQSTRTRLARAMLEDVAEAASGYGGDEVALVTSDVFAIEVAERYGFEMIRDDANRSETDAIEMATRAAEERGTESTLVIPGDIPLIEAADFHAIYNAAPACGAVLVPSGDGRGSNAVLRRPAALCPLRFGNDSFAPHLAAAKASGSFTVLNLPRIGLDIDTPEDLQRLAKAAGEKRSQALAREFLSQRSGEREVTPGTEPRVYAPTKP